MFIVIEGDNATGKTTIGKMLENKGFIFLTESKDIKDLEYRAKEYAVGTMERVRAFLDYNKKCSEVIKPEDNTVLARYWVSSVAAAYADCVVCMTQAMDIANKCLKDLRKPDFIFRLNCARSVRLKRIEIRNNTSKLSDEISSKRENRYSYFLNEVSSKGLVDFIDITTDDTGPDDVLKAIESFIL